MYKQLYSISFKDIHENDVRVEIYKETDQDVRVSELLAASDPVTIDYNGEDDVFKPLKLSGCKINVLTPEILTELYSGKANEITAKVFRNDRLFWFGYLTPNIYSSDYIDECNNLTLEFVDTVSILEHSKYEASLHGVRSFWQIMGSIFDRVDSEKAINDIYIHNSLKVNDSDDILKQLYISTRNFFDEENEPQTCKEVIEDLTRFLGMSLVQFENKYLFIDYESFNQDYKNSFIRYDRTTGEVVKTTLPVNLIDANSNIYESNASISLNDIYNKIIVVANSNPVGKITPELFDSEDLINQNIDPNKYYESSELIKEGDKKKEYILLTSFHKSKENWSYLEPTTGDLEMPLDEITPDNIESLNACTFWQHCDSYKKEDGEPSTYKWSNYLTFYQNKYNDTNNFIPFLTLKKKASVLLKEGCFILNLTYKMSGFPYAHSIKKTEQQVFLNGKYYRFDDTQIPCRLTVGEHYFDGERFIHYNEYHNKVACGYYKSLTGLISDYNVFYFFYIDESGYKCFVTEPEYNALPHEVVKEKGEIYNATGGYVSSYFFTNESGDRVFVNDEFYQECYLRDRFYLIHKNNEGDKIFDEEKSLTNSVSYKMNLADAEDGVAIKLPSSVALHGDIVFQLFRPNHLGKQPSTGNDNGGTVSEYCHAFHFTNLFLKYTTDKGMLNLFTGETDESDLKFENVINSDYVNELEDIELKVNTYNNNSVSYSFVATKIGDQFDYIERVYNTNVGQAKSQEEHIMSKYYDYYSIPKFKYENTLNNVGITPVDLLFESSMNKFFFIRSVTYNLSNSSVEISCNEV